MRWRLLALITDQLLTLFGYSATEKLDLITLLRRGFGYEFNETGDLRKQLGKKYQASRQILIKDLETIHHPDDVELDAIQKTLFPLVLHWKAAVKPHVNTIRDNLSSMTSFSKDELLGSLLHMSNNRIFKAYGREHELVMHDFMRRYYLYRSKVDQ